MVRDGPSERVVRKRDGMKRVLRENWLTLAVLVMIVGGYVFLRTPGDDLSSTEVFDAQATNGEPLVVEFYSNT